VYAYLQKSEYKKAKDVESIIDTLGGTFEPSPVTAYAVAGIPGRIALEFQNWEEAENLSLVNYSEFPWKKFPQYEALTYFAKGIGAGRNGNAKNALLAFQKLEELQNSFENSEANKYWIDQIEIQKTTVKAWQMYADGEKEKSLETMITAAELEDKTEKNPVTPGSLLPAREMLGDLYMELNRPQDALKQYELSLKNNPNRFNSLYGAGKSAELAGNMQKARFYYTAVLKLGKSPEVKREQIAHAVEVTGSKT
jgi:tetratricopeptide (TPR) repeat protein